MELGIMLSLLFIVVVFFLTGCIISNKNPKTLLLGALVKKPFVTFNLSEHNQTGKTMPLTVKINLPLDERATTSRVSIPGGDGMESAKSVLYIKKQSYSIKVPILEEELWVKDHFTNNGFILGLNGENQIRNEKRMMFLYGRK